MSFKSYFKRGVRILKVSLIGASLIGATIPSSVRADVDDLTLLKKLYTKLSDSMVLDSNQGVRNKTFLVLFNPGMLVDPNLDLTKPIDRFSFFSMVDQVVEPSWFFAQSYKTMYNLYGNILNNRVLPIVKLSDAEEAELATAKKALYSSDAKSKLYEDYLQKKRQFSLVFDQVESFKNVNPSQPVTAVLSADLQAATDDFEIWGICFEVEGYIDSFKRLTYKSGNGKWVDLRNMYNGPDAYAAIGPSKKVGAYSFYPQYKSWFDPQLNWTKISTSQSEIEKITENSSSSGGGNVGAGFSLWSFQAKGSGTNERSYKKNTTSDFALEGEYTQIRLFRLYANEDDVFDTDAWTWPKTNTPGVSTAQISNGIADLNAGVFPAGQMPFLPVGFLLAKNVKLAAKWEQDIDEFTKSHREGGLGFSWGPFSFGGRGNHDESRRYESYKKAGAGVEMTTPQVIGVYIRVLDRLPRPNAEYKWPEDAKLDYGPSPKVVMVPDVRASFNERLENALMLSEARKTLREIKDRK